MKNFSHSHSHGHSNSRWHIWCSATLIYNILVIAFEILAQLFFTTHSWEDIFKYELTVQAFHIFWIIILWAIQMNIIHNLKQNSKTFILVWSLFIVFHIIFLHILPRTIWVLHEWENESWEFLRIILIAVLVTILFLIRDPVLRYFWLKNKRILKKN